MSEPIYIVFGEQGCYEDRHEWIIGVHTDLKTARQVAEDNREEPESPYGDPLYTHVETWTVGTDSMQLMKTMYKARWHRDGGVQSTWTDGYKDLSDEIADLDESSEQYVYRGGHSKAEAEARLAEALRAEQR